MPVQIVSLDGAGFRLQELESASPCHRAGGDPARVTNIYQMDSRLSSRHPAGDCTGGQGADGMVDANPAAAYHKVQPGSPLGCMSKRTKIQLIQGVFDGDSTP
jgi:hypothetical protein